MQRRQRSSHSPHALRSLFISYRWYKHESLTLSHSPYHSETLFSAPSHDKREHVRSECRDGKMTQRRNIITWLYAYGRRLGYRFPVSYQIHLSQNLRLIKGRIQVQSRRLTMQVSACLWKRPGIHIAPDDT